MRTLTIIAIGFGLMFALFICAGNAVEAFVDTVDGTNGVMGSSYSTDK